MVSWRDLSYCVILNFYCYFLFPGDAQDDLLDLIVGMQSKRMDEQRVALPHLPGLCPPGSSNSQSQRQRLSLASGVDATPDDQFLEMLMRSQVTILSVPVNYLSYLIYLQSLILSFSVLVSKINVAFSQAARKMLI